MLPRILPPGVLQLAVAVLAALPSSSLVRAEDFSGTIVVKHKLTHHSVTPTLSDYMRGPAVALTGVVDGDALDWERERVVVYLEGPGPAAASGSASGRPSARRSGTIITPDSEMKQSGRQFLPDLVVVAAGSLVSFPNMDPVFHNVFSLSAAKSFDLGNYKQGDTRTVSFPKPGIVNVNCRLHPNMAGTVLVTPNGWFARVAKDGSFRITDIPPGVYTAVAWHKTAGFFRQRVDVAEGRGASASFLIPLDENGEMAPAARSAAQQLKIKAAR